MATETKPSAGEDVKIDLFEDDDEFEEFEISEAYGKDSTEASTSQSERNTIEGGNASPDDLAGLYDFMDSTGLLVPQKSDLEIYLDEACVKCPYSEFDILEWWKMSAMKYKTLSKMAKDIFTIPVTTVASESAFSAGGRVLSDYRSSISPRTLDALVCSGNWIRAAYKSSKDPLFDALVEENLVINVPESLSTESEI